MNKSDLLDWLQKEDQEWESLLDEIGSTRMEEPGVNGVWSMKDMIAHLTCWNRNLVAQMQAAQRGEPNPPPPWPANLEDQDDINAWIYEAYRERSLSDVRGESRQVFQQLLILIESLPDTFPIEIYRDDRDKAFYLVRLGENRFPAGEFFYHYHDDHEPDIRAWMARV